MLAHREHQRVPQATFRTCRDHQWIGVTFLPNGNGEFTPGMGMLVDKQDLGFGQRS
jgi:peroxiredoxin